MKTTTKRFLMATGAAIVALGIGSATVAGVAQARGWGDGPDGCGQRGPGMMGQSGGPGMMGQRGGGGGPLAMIDADQDGTVTRAEFDTFHGLAFKAMDADGDGQVERQAFLDARTAGPQRNGGNRSGWRAEQRTERMGQRFDVWDADGNGIVTEAEFTTQAEARFQSMDLDGDGQVTGQEMAAQRMFGPRGAGMGPNGG